MAARLIPFGFGLGTAMTVAPPRADATRQKLVKSWSIRSCPEGSWNVTRSTELSVAAGRPARRRARRRSVRLPLAK